MPLVVPTPDGLGTSEHERPTNAADSLARELSESLRTDGTALLLELEPSLGVQVAARLHQQQLAYVVLVLPRWPHAGAILPIDQLVATLVVESRRLASKTEKFRNLAIVLDSERQQRINRPANDPRIDNRYRVSEGELPKLTELRSAAIRRVVKVTQQ